MSQVAETLAQAVRGVRDLTRLGQRDFAVAAGIGKNTLGNAEKGQKSTPETLRLIADAAAREAAGNERPSADDLYHRLMRAAGYIDDRPPSPPNPEHQRPPSGALSEDAIRVSVRQNALAEIATLLQKVPEASIALTDLSRGVDDWDDEDYEYVLTQLRRLARRYGRSQIAC